MNNIHRTRRGTTITELLVAILLLGTGATIIGKTVPLLARQRQRNFQVDLAREELCQQLEFLTRLDAGQLANAIDHLEISEATAGQLCQPSLTGKLITNDLRLGNDATAIQLQLRWIPPIASTTQSESLETWIFPDDRGAAIKSRFSVANRSEIVP